MATHTHRPNIRQSDLRLERLACGIEPGERLDPAQQRAITLYAIRQTLWYSLIGVIVACVTYVLGVAFMLVSP